MPEHPPETVTSLEELIARAATAPRPTVLIDGGSGAGKTSLGFRLAPALGAQLVSLDDIYPGWDGLEAGSAAVVTDVLRTADPGWRGWDWTSALPGRWHPLDPGRPIVIEGCGALSRAARRRATLGVWVELDAAERRRRALGRDGDAYAPHWDRWARQEEAFWAREHPQQIADVTWPG
jgi:uridine kinase